ncbi:vacuolar fusion protein MON1 homolog B-like isoform X2 [Dendropsophus ebraccatus]|uniref:vacuolar fusion protein MON1 homolog B-like isoform X2 n=2 Tax=Dendropsophus ebraccatus TaxID=150705 RepID=UPI003831DBDC
MSGASRDVGAMAEDPGKEKLETDHQGDVETSHSPQTLASAQDAPEVQAPDIGSESSEDGHDPRDDRHRCVLEEDTDATITQCSSSDGAVEGTDATITQCYKSDRAVEGTDATITQCSSSDGAVKGTDATITQCYSSDGVVEGTDATITQCYSSDGAVEGTDATITQCYSLEGAVEGTDATITQCSSLEGVVEDTDATITQCRSLEGAVEGTDATITQCRILEGAVEGSSHGTTHETQQISCIETEVLLEETENSDVDLPGGQEVTSGEDTGRCVPAAADTDGETGGLIYDGSQPPHSVHTVSEDTACKVPEDNDIAQIHEKSTDHRNIEASTTETKPEDLVDTDQHGDDHKELTDSASDNALEDSGDFPGISSVVGGVTTSVSPPVTPVQREEDVTAESWRTKRKHVFVLSEAGKPIYSRYGNEEALSSTMGVMMALVSFVQSGNNIIRSIHSDKQKVVFLQQGPLVLVSVSRAPQSEEQLRKELQYVYYQIISMLTQASVARIFERKKNYDLRRLLAGSEKILDSLLDLLDTDPGFLLGAVRCVALPSPLRDSLSSILTKAITPNLVFSILVAEQQLVTVVQERAVIEDCRLDPADLHLLLNLIGASSAFQAGEIWTPICLPRFNPDGYFYAYISYLDPECTVCLVLLSTDKESFYAVSGCKRKIQEAMEAQNSLQALAGALRCCSYSVSLVGVPELLHFVYKPLDIPDPYRQLPQFTSPEPDGPYSNAEEKQRLFDLYRYLHCRIHSSTRPLRLIYHVAEKETLLAWVTSKFELYTAFSSLVTKVGAINVITKLLRWIKREEDRLFIRYPPKYSTTPVPGKGVKSNRTDRTDPSQNGFFTGL